MKKQKINDEILSNRVILIGNDGRSYGEVSYDQARLLAYDKDLDLVEVGSNSNPPITKMMDYGKEIYREQKKLSKQRAKQKAPELKEIKLSSRIDEHDFQVKINRAKEFFAEGDKVRVFIKLIGREMFFKDKAHQIIDKFKTDVGAEYEQATKRLGSQFSAILKKKK